jgi:hypothetical protein
MVYCNCKAAEEGKEEKEVTGKITINKLQGCGGGEGREGSNRKDKMGVRLGMKDAHVVVFREGEK